MTNQLGFLIFAKYVGLKAFEILKRACLHTRRETAVQNSTTARTSHISLYSCLCPFDIQLLISCFG